MFKFAVLPISVKEATLATLQLYKTTFAKIWYIFIPYWLAGMYSFAGYFLGFPKRAHDKTFYIYATGSLIIWLIALYFKCVALYQMQEEVTGHTTIDVAMRTMWKKYFVVLINQVLVGLATAALLLLGVIPGVFVGGLLILCLPLILFDNRSIFDAIRDSWSLVWGNWWRAFCVIAVPLVLIMVLTFSYLQLIDYHEPYLLGCALILSLISGFVFFPIYLAALLVVFNDLKLRKRKVVVRAKPKRGRPKSISNF